MDDEKLDKMMKRVRCGACGGKPVSTLAGTLFVCTWEYPWHGTPNGPRLAMGALCDDCVDKAIENGSAGLKEVFEMSANGAILYHPTSELNRVEP